MEHPPEGVLFVVHLKCTFSEAPFGPPGLIIFVAINLADVWVISVVVRVAFVPPPDGGGFALV